MGSGAGLGIHGMLVLTRVRDTLSTSYVYIA
jgi:hypothetical protein